MTFEVFFTAVFLMLAAACHAFNTFWYFHGNKSKRHPFSFFGIDSWKRKYKRSTYSVFPHNERVYDLIAAPDNWYYDIFKIRYKEKFPLSATVLVFVTDGYHLVQWFMIKFLILAMVVRYDHGIKFIWWNAICLYILWLIVFNVVYTKLRR